MQIKYVPKAFHMDSDFTVQQSSNSLTVIIFLEETVENKLISSYDCEISYCLLLFSQWTLGNYAKNT